jgi:hypothetical protein
MKELEIKVRDEYIITVTDEEYEILMEGNDRPKTVEECKVKEDIVRKHILEQKKEDIFDNTYCLNVYDISSGEEVIQVW